PVGHAVQGKVIKTRSVEYMPFVLSLVNFLNGCCWTGYALIKFDLYITVSTTIASSKRQRNDISMHRSNYLLIPCRSPMASVPSLASPS
uniref:Uncharacterized protein n=1 Tax=Aegilops tauschii subsp. strangulata TaxID=200361 RepID=A0A452ZPI6_AEGTS